MNLPGRRRNLVVIAVDRLMAITPRGYPRRGAARGSVVRRRDAPWWSWPV